jgi:hypothetical protein
MKIILSIVAAGLLGAGGIAAAAPADAQTVVRERTVTTTRHRGPARWHTRRVCENKWRHHRKVRVCRTERYRR